MTDPIPDPVDDPNEPLAVADGGMGDIDPDDDDPYPVQGVLPGLEPWGVHPPGT